MSEKKDFVPVGQEKPADFEPEAWERFEQERAPIDRSKIVVEHLPPPIED